MKKYTLNDVEKFLVLKTWYASIFILPLSNRLTLFIVNYTKIKPNQITIFAFILRIFAGVLFFKGLFITAAITYYFSYVFDCTDGVVARLTNQTSNFGRYLDHILDLIGDLWVLIFFHFKVFGTIFTHMIVGMVFMHISESYISYLASFAINNKYLNSNILQIINRYRRWWFDKNFKSFISYPDYTAFLFIFMPLINKVKLGFKIGFYMLFIVVCYTIFSTFVSIHTGDKRFP